MILLESILHDAIKPMYKLLPGLMNTCEASVMLLAIGLQESRFMYRYQKLVGQPYRKGPAKGFWQFECGGGVVGVMEHHNSHYLVQWLCQQRKIVFEDAALHARLEEDDVLAAGMARLLLWTDKSSLPGLDAGHEVAWEYYLRNWRPGRPHRETWDEFHQQALDQVINSHLVAALPH